MSTEQRKRWSYLTLVLLGIAFIAAIIASNSLLRGMQIDLTENKLFTLAPGTRSFLRNIDEPINLYFFFSDQATADNNDYQGLRLYVTRVREMLEEFEQASNGKLHLTVIDPIPFSEDEDRAAQYGLRNIALGTAGDSIYFGLAATNSYGDEAVIDVFDPSKEGSLEYDVARLIYSLASPEKNVIGLISGVPMSGGFDPQTQQPSQPWVITQQARQLFDVRTLPPSTTQIAPDIDMLWIVQPIGLDEQTLYAIDQYLLGGGRALIFVDPLAEVAAATAGPTGGGTSSTLEPLFGAWGLDYDPAEVVADNRYALSVDTGTGRRPQRHIGLVGLDDQAMDQEDVVTAGLDSVNLGTAGHLEVASDANITLTALLSSSAESMVVPAAKFQFLGDPEELLDDFSPTGQRYVLAARIEGTLKTAFPDGPPASAAEAETEPTAEAETEPTAEAETEPTAEGGTEPTAAAAAGAEQLMSSDDPHVIVVADVDILSDRLWVQLRRSLFGQQVATAFASNGDFVTNAIANLSGSADLIGLRSRATFSRPFDKVEALRREADARFRETEQQLEAQLSETERRLGELQSSREDRGSLLMSPEQQAEVERFQAEQLRIRRELRAVQRELDSSIERLGTVLKVVNILAVPVALGIIALVVVFLKRRRRRGSAA